MLINYIKNKFNDRVIINIRHCINIYIYIYGIYICFIHETCIIVYRSAIWHDYKIFLNGYAW